MERKEVAFAAAQRILDELEEIGCSLESPDYVICKESDLPEPLHCAWGASRLVIWDNKCDYVIKVARDKDLEKYNEHEAEVYAAAVNEGLEDNFAWCACYLSPQENFPGVYVMEFLDGDEDMVCDSAYNYGYELYCRTHDPDDDEGYDDVRPDNDERELLDLVECHMTYKEANTFERFLSDWYVDDLHSGNMLFRGDRLVICDYAGWGWA